MEEWLKIDPPFSRYSVSSGGMVRNDETDYIFSKQKNIIDYPQINIIQDNGKGKQKFVHVLVAQQFLGYTPEMQKNRQIVCHHKDNDKQNSRLSNLEIISVSENNKYCNNLRKNSKTIQQFNLNGDFIKEYKPNDKINNEWKRININNCCNNQQKTAYGFIWKYISEENLDGEIWKEIEFNNKIIKVSNLGRIKISYDVITSGYKKQSGYRSIGINGKRMQVHRLVCQTFHPIDNPEDFVVNHINHVKDDNRAENLEWTTQRENCKKYLEKNPNQTYRNVRKCPVVGIKNNEIIYFKTSEDACIWSRSKHISDVCKGKRKSAGGFKWMYLEDYEKLKSS